jgi:hypothetical protein
MEYIKFIVDGQKLNYNSRRYVSTDTIDTLFCRFKFEIDSSGHVRGGWNLPFIWAQFHDEKGNVYVKPVKDGVCSIPYDCLRQHEFKMTLFATDTEDYMVCKKRYTTNEVSFKFKGLANLNYDGGVSPDEHMPTNWQILIDRVDECENKVDGLSQDVAAIGDKVDGIDSRVTANTTAIDDLSQDVTSIHGSLDDLNTELDTESTARKTADANLQSAINDRYTKTETDTLINAESVARANADADLQSAIQEEATTRSEAIDGVNDTINELNTKLDDESTARESADTRLEGLIGDRYTKIETDALLNAESAARANADTNLQSLINDEINNRISGDNALQNKLNERTSAFLSVEEDGVYINYTK